MGLTVWVARGQASHHAYRDQGLASEVEAPDGEAHGEDVEARVPLYGKQQRGPVQGERVRRRLQQLQQVSAGLGGVQDGPRYFLAVFFFALRACSRR